jgi:Asp-tRNA(Asn)/Glu-tRNA(Gln) amidotransferase A subunit family amidase
MQFPWTKTERSHPTGAATGDAIVVSGLRKTFGDFVAVDNVDFRVKRGEIFGFLGPNGSGKTTTIRMLCGVIAPTSGGGTVMGYDVVDEPERVRENIGYMSQKFSLFQDVLLTPTSPTTAFKIGEKAADPVSMYLSDVYTIPVNLAGIPAVSVPCGSVDGLPVGLQIMGTHFAEATILRAAYAVEQACGFEPVPPLVKGLADKRGTAAS